MYSLSSAGGRGGNATVELVVIVSATSRVDSESSVGASTPAEGFLDVGNGFSLSLRQVKDRTTSAKHAQKPKYLQLRLGLEMTE